MARRYSRGHTPLVLTWRRECTNQDLFIVFICVLYRTSPESSVSLVTSLWIERAGHRCSKIGRSNRLLSSAQNSHRLWRPGALWPGVYAWSYISTPPIRIHGVMIDEAQKTPPIKSICKLILHLINHHAIKTYGGSGRLSPRIFSLYTRCRLSVVQIIW